MKSSALSLKQACNCDYCQAKVQISDPGNTAPLFPDQDLATVGDQTDETSREIAENTPAKVSRIGSPVMPAEDDDDDLRLYTLSGTDADSFGIEQGDRPADDQGASWTTRPRPPTRWWCTATDPSGAS